MLADLIAEIQNNPDWVPYGVGLIAALVLLALGLFVWRRSTLVGAVANLDEQLEAHRDAATEMAQALADQRVELAGFEAMEAGHDQRAQELNTARQNLTHALADVARLKATLDHQTETSGTLKSQFTTLANEVMQVQSETFKKSNAVQLSQVLQPLKEHIGRFETELRGVHIAADKDRAALKTEILNLTKQSLEVSNEAHNLTQALKGDSQKQGAWGEMILASILDRSGLREGAEYETQAHHRDDEGRSLRPDVVVNLPGGRRLVIDSKVSLVAYERSANAESDAARLVALKAHVQSVRTHIDTLSAKKYHQLDDGAIDYVIMFMPIESAFSEAVRVDADLALYANEKNVVIASPMNLMVALKTVENLWNVDKRNKNALEIAKRAGLLYDKFHGFAEDMDKIGVQLDRAQGAHGAAMGKLTEGRGNLVSQVETLKKLGARASKQIEVAHDEDDLLPPPDDAT